MKVDLGRTEITAATWNIQYLTFDKLEPVMEENYDMLAMNGIPYLLLKECAQELCEPLTLLYRFICKKGGGLHLFKTVGTHTYTLPHNRGGYHASGCLK